MVQRLLDHQEPVGVERAEQLHVLKGIRGVGVDR